MGHYDSTVYNDNLAVSAELNSTLTPIINQADDRPEQVSCSG